VWGVQRSFVQALLALRLASGMDLGLRSPTAYRDLSAHTRLLCELDRASLRTIADGVCGTLRDHDAESGSELLATLHHYLASGCSANVTAEALFLHRNTLHKRLSKIESLTGLDLSRASGLTEVTSALVAETVLGVRGLVLAD